MDASLICCHGFIEKASKSNLMNSNDKITHQNQEENIFICSFSKEINISSTVKFSIYFEIDSMKVLSFKYLYGRTKLIINFASKRSRNKLLKNVLFFYRIIQRTFRIQIAS